MCARRKCEREVRWVVVWTRRWTSTLPSRLIHLPASAHNSCSPLDHHQASSSQRYLRLCGSAARSVPHVSNLMTTSELPPPPIAERAVPVPVPYLDFTSHAPFCLTTCIRCVHVNTADATLFSTRQHSLCLPHFLRTSIPLSPKSHSASTRDIFPRAKIDLFQLPASDRRSTHLQLITTSSTYNHDITFPKS